MRKIIIVAIALLISSYLYSQQNYDIDFIQTKVVKLSGKTTEKAGHLTYDGAEQLSMTYTNPDGDYFNIDGMKVQINLDGKKANLDAEKAKTVKLQRATLLNCLSGHWDQAAIDNNAEVTTTEEDGLKTITLTAQGKVPRGGYASVVLTYRINDGTLVKLILEEAVGSINTYELDL